MTGHKTVDDYVPIARSMTGDAFVQRYCYPFLFGREVLEEEFRFATQVTDAKAASLAAEPAEQLRIHHWVIAVRKPAAAPAQDRIFLGRSETNDVCVPHKTVSKLHAYFQKEVARDPKDVSWFLVDAGSANGTKHNGARIVPRTRTALHDGDALVFGRCVFSWMTARSLYERVLALASSPN